MNYPKMCEANFIERENRFVATVSLPGGEITKVHVKNTGRCRELLRPGCRVYLEDCDGRMGKRKMRYSLVAVRKEPAGAGRAGGLLVNMDSQAPNKVVGEALADGRIRLPLPGGTCCGGKPLLIKPEARFGNSRFDFYVETAGGPRTEAPARAFIEVKGVTLEEDGHARFPDAPTERGVKHINELIRARKEGYGAYIIFLVQMEGMEDVSPNDETHPLFGQTLAEAAKAGVRILAYDCLVSPGSLEVKGQIPFILTGRGKDK